MAERIWVAWGAGEICKRYLQRETSRKFSFIIDNDLKKDGSFYLGIPVVHPSKIGDWTRYKIVILVDAVQSVSKQLESYGLEREKDFVYGEFDVPGEVSFDILQEALTEIAFGDTESEFEIEIRSKEEYLEVSQRYKAAVEYEYNLDKIISRMPQKSAGYKAFCACCKKEVFMRLDYQFVFAGKPAWRESAICPYCRCNSRMRYVVERTLKNVQKRDANVYIYEQITNTYQALKRFIPKLEGSEYLGDDKEGGRAYDGIIHQDAMNLSYVSDSMDIIISNDVFEHVADYRKAFNESYRILRDGGKMIFSVPLYKTRETTTTRARINADGDVEHLQEPTYHGNPLSNEGCLVFHEYSWDILQLLKEAGFRDAYFIVYFSAKKAYFGYLPIIIEAVK